jgi:hypothetical protein
LLSTKESFSAKVVKKLKASKDRLVVAMNGLTEEHGALSLSLSPPFHVNQCVVVTMARKSTVRALKTIFLVADAVVIPTPTRSKLVFSSPHPLAVSWKLAPTRSKLANHAKVRDSTNKFYILRVHSLIATDLCVVTKDIPSFAKDRRTAALTMNCVTALMMSHH